MASKVPSAALIAILHRYVREFRNAYVGLDVVAVLRADGLYGETLTMAGASFLSTHQAADCAARRYLGAELVEHVQRENVRHVHGLWK